MIGYKLREKIRKALQARSEAIRKALERYNAAAKSLTPARVTLTWTSVIEQVQLGELSLLQHSRQHIRVLPWMQPLNREAARLHFKILRAREEIVRRNVEIQRQITFMLDNFNDYQHAIAAVSTEDPNLATELQERLDYQVRIDEEIAKKLYDASRLPGFTGTLMPGTHVGREPFRSTDTLPPWATTILGLVIDSDTDGVDIGNSDTPPDPHPATGETLATRPVMHEDGSQGEPEQSDGRQTIGSTHPVSEVLRRNQLVAEIQQLQEELDGVQLQQMTHNNHSLEAGTDIANLPT
ncbi:hypothetical protein FISHEDRAFT_46445 [Fistulina hepatica ATCC 64428]|uniref:Uncharacterized protein n=1 Tax=Fistulina hepatica ATCC 64428 TaxID=1128425 RepID=A0A0D7A7B8_9AGAR|nr:hypothetical protein FISHEDRAFT_46445 [Fistulina hepatica ATCC 64428]